MPPKFKYEVSYNIEFQKKKKKKKKDTPQRAGSAQFLENQRFNFVGIYHVKVW